MKKQIAIYFLYYWQYKYNQDKGEHQSILDKHVRALPPTNII